MLIGDATTETRWLIKGVAVLVVLAALLVPAWLIARRGGYRRRALLQAGTFFGAANFAVLAVAIALDVNVPGDYAASVYFQGSPHQRYFHLIDAFSALGSVYVVVPVTVLLALLFGLRSVRAGLYILTTMLVSTVINLVAKGLFQRPPPGGSEAQSIALFAFPSGHTMRTMTLALALTIVLPRSRWRWPVAAAAILLAVLIGLSRIYIGSHFFSDVVGGWSLALTVACGVALLSPRLFPEPLEVDGAAAPDLGGVEDAAPRDLEVVLFDWGDTLMVDHGFDGPMAGWPNVEAVPGAAQVLSALADDYVIGVATNTDDSGAELVEAALRRVGLAEHVAQVFSSRDIGARKPEPAFYAAVLRGLGAMRGDATPLRPDRAVMIGDNYVNDVAGAKRAGLRTIWFNQDDRQPLGESASDHDAVIESLEELPAALGRLDRT